MASPPTEPAPKKTPSPPPQESFRPGLDTAYKMVGPLIFGLAMGYLIDDYFGTRPWGMLSLMLFGMITGFWSILKQVYYPDLVRPDPPLKEKKTQSEHKPKDSEL